MRDLIRKENHKIFFSMNHVLNEIKRDVNKLLIYLLDFFLLSHFLKLPKKNRKQIQYF
jgi:hypothetical protein